MLLLKVYLDMQLLQYLNHLPLRRTGMELSRVSRRHRNQYSLNLLLDLILHLIRLFRHHHFHRQVRRLCLNHRHHHRLLLLLCHLSDCSNHFRPLRSRSLCHLHRLHLHHHRRRYFDYQLSFLRRPRYLDH